VPKDFSLSDVDDPLTDSEGFFLHPEYSTNYQYLICAKFRGKFVCLSNADLLNKNTKYNPFRVQFL